MVVAAQKETIDNEDPRTWSHVRVATKYPNITQNYFEERGVHAECIKLNGAMELAPSMGLCKRIVDLVESGSTLKANGLVEIEEICEVSTRLAVNRSYLKTNSEIIQPWIDKIEEVIND
jgi:ATP phosphoribosyltransferase